MHRLLPYDAIDRDVLYCAVQTVDEELPSNFQQSRAGISRATPSHGTTPWFDHYVRLSHIAIEAEKEQFSSRLANPFHYFLDDFDRNNQLIEDIEKDKMVANFHGNCASKENHTLPSQIGELWKNLEAYTTRRGITKDFQGIENSVATRNHMYIDRRISNMEINLGILTLTRKFSRNNQYCINRALAEVEFGDQRLPFSITSDGRNRESIIQVGIFKTKLEAL